MPHHDKSHRPLAHQRGHRSGVNDDTHLALLIDQAVQNLLSELQQGKSGKLLEYLAFGARFHQYSLHNQLLIYSQCPQATRVAGYRTWQSLGYQVAKGEKGIRILAPHTYKRRDEETGEENPAVYFVSVAVFDASQLAGVDERPLPEFFTRLEDDQAELCARLERMLEGEGISVRESPYTERAQGYSAHGEIVLRSGLDSRSKLFVLIHEYTHELLHWTEAGRSLARPLQECHAEAVSYIVAAHFGLRNVHSADYLQSWGTTPAELMQELDIVRATAASIIGKVSAPVIGVAQSPRVHGAPAGLALE
jgi:antirestriction protein ArdC